MPLKRITPGLKQNSLFTGKKLRYIDVDLNFIPKSGAINEQGVVQGDVFKKVDTSAVIQSVENILLTNHYEKPFNLFYGANLRVVLFELVEQYSEKAVRRMIVQALKRDEPRVEVTDVTFYDGTSTIEKGVQRLADSIKDPRNTVYITVEFRIENSDGLFTATVNLNRLR